ncbi:pentapeptide repeat-containing protein [Pseudonocardia sp. TRM90224]|uniref:pentapeptide repeat-containing protein n=1 Tax=Pseudonocardia sp. TRM90224 TaxID=2812678 RepID=UPI001E3B78EF|nr:pentapeptide repeat-containing protein [Pseudonocardia sp. TRM90224]
MRVDLPITDARRELRADCERCFGLCCVAPAFAASSDFAIDKPAGQPCHKLQDDFRCGIHSRLRESGFAGCTVFDCFGAGQHVAQRTFGGRSWRDEPATAPQMFAVFAVARQLAEIRWYLVEAIELPAAAALRPELQAAAAENRRLLDLAAGELVDVDVDEHRSEINTLLLRTSELVRAGAPREGVDRRGADLIGKRMRRADLRGANLRGAYLIGADLREADLRMADVIGADLRGADLRGARLDGAVFLTQFQVNAARGDSRTTLPAALLRPPHWA